MTRIDNDRQIRSPHGTTLSAKSWLTEAPLRMLMNNLDPDVAEKPSELVVYGGVGRAARDWQSFDRIVASLRSLEADETLLVQSGKPVGVFRTHPDAPRVLIANSNLVPHWATWEHFNELDRKGLMMFGQMTAGSWIYIGSQGIVQGTYETFVEMGRQHYGGSLAGRWILTAGSGRHGRRAADGRDHGRRLLPRHRMPAEQHRVPPAHRLCRLPGQGPRRRAGDHPARDGGEEGGIGRPARQRGRDPARAAAPRRAARLRHRPDLGARSGQRLPAGGLEPRRLGGPAQPRIRPAWRKRRRSRWPAHVRAMLEFHKLGVPTVDYGNNIRQMALEEGVADAFAFPGFVPAYVRPLFCRGIGPFRWAALSGDPEDIYRTDEKVKELLPDNKHLHNWLDMARKRIKFQGLPARICWVGLGDRDRLGLAFNEMVAKGELKAPIVIGRDHLDSGSVASPNRETEAMRDGTDAVSDWPMLNALLNCASGATWVSLHHGGGVGIGFSQHAGMVIVCDGTPEAAKRIARVLWNDPATGVMRHADAGYEDRDRRAPKEKGLDFPV